MPPAILQHLQFDNFSSDRVNYQTNIRLYNMMFAFTSVGAKFDRSINNDKGPPTIRIQGQPCHRIGSMLPMSGNYPKFAQLYIYDTEHEIENIMEGIRMARERLKDGVIPNLKLKLISERNSDGTVNNLPTVSKVAALIV
ncbi:hypothetical protein Lal_00030212 [Lupinus albus]|nr:hypothetical protein Lal_00030212 [Lupinus albus]